MLRARFEPTIPVLERSTTTRAVDRESTGTGVIVFYNLKFKFLDRRQEDTYQNNGIAF